MREKGTLVSDGQYATLTFVRAYRHSPEDVWDAISTPEGLREWLLCSSADIEPREGGRIELVSGPTNYRSTGKILAWEPSRLLEYEWNVEPLPEMPEGERAIFRYELSWDGAVTRLVVTYRRMTHATAKGFIVGVHAFLERLECQLGGSSLPDFLGLFGRLRPEYPDWIHDAPASGK